MSFDPHGVEWYDGKNDDAYPPILISAGSVRRGLDYRYL